MCGIAGLFQKKDSIYSPQGRSILESALDLLQHRGPDNDGFWVSSDSRVALGHRRLSVLDLSQEGNQPMSSIDGRFWITYNGEVYNHRDLKKKLKEHGMGFRGHSDTEVLLAAIDAWGIVKTLHNIAGMFAFAFWDVKEKVLHLVRDRMGEKPLYYGWVGNVFVFASELKAFRAHPEWHGEINRSALASYLRYSYIPSPYSIYQGIYKLLPGCRLAISCENIERHADIVPDPEMQTGGNTIVPIRYWSLADTLKSGTENTFRNYESGTAVTELNSIFRKVVDEHQYADVPTGVLLSGGMDSSLVAALAQIQSTSKLRTFTVDFSESQYSEARYAANVAKCLGTDHSELHVAPADALDVIESLPAIYDEPFADASQMPTVLISRFARQSVKVALTGDGGDEVFGGYNRYLWLERARKYKHCLPWIVTKTIARSLNGVAPDRWDRIYDSIVPGVLTKGKLRHPGESLHKFAWSLLANDTRAMYINTVSHWLIPVSVVRNAVEPDVMVTRNREWDQFPGFVQKMMYLDTASYLPDDILVKVDRASMSTGLEVRSPFLDRRIVDFAARLPLNQKIRNGQTKWLLRQLLYRYVPKKLVDRPKMGFAVPIAAWLRGSLHDWAETLLDEQRLRREGFFYPEPIRSCWNEHLSGKCNRQYQLWGVLMFQAWLEQQKI